MKLSLIKTDENEYRVVLDVAMLDAAMPNVAMSDSVALDSAPESSAPDSDLPKCSLLDSGVVLFSYIFLSEYEQKAFMERAEFILKNGDIKGKKLAQITSDIQVKQLQIIEQYLPLAKQKIRECNNAIAIFLADDAPVPINRKIKMLLNQLADLREDIMMKWERLLREFMRECGCGMPSPNACNKGQGGLDSGTQNLDMQNFGAQNPDEQNLDMQNFGTPNPQDDEAKEDIGAEGAQSDKMQNDKMQDNETAENAEKDAEDDAQGGQTNINDEEDDDDDNNDDDEYAAFGTGGQIAKHRYSKFHRYRTKLHQKSLKDLSKILGNMFALKSSGEEKSIEKGGITFARDLANVLPSELVYLGDEMGALFELKYMQNNLACFAPKTSQGKERGAMILALDASASMSGKPWEVTRAIAAFLGEQAIAQKRPLYLIYFDTSITTLEVLGAQDSSALEGFLSISADGGTDVEPAIDEAVAKVRQKAFKNADILVISDFILGNTNDVESALKQLPQGNKAYALTIDSSSFASAHKIGAIQSHFHAQYALNPQNNKIIKLGEKNKKAQKRL